MKPQNLLTLAATAALITSASASVTIDYVSVGNAGNAADSTGYGAVAYAYQIGKYEVTNAQYGAFLNAADPTGANANGIYNADMGSDARGGITYTAGAASGAKYTIRTSMGDKPVNYVSWYDAARFANWLHNGQGSGSTETGAYTLNGATSGIITANIGAQVYLPSENEWYKAAYYSAANESYSLYPNGQNTITTADANYGNVVGSTTDVGSYSGDGSSYGTFDQGGNVWEWNDAVTSLSRGVRGGSFDGGENGLRASYSLIFDSQHEGNSIGFRVASVPEPTSLLLTMLAGGVMLARRKR
jgi:formylglycine-generating enzyme required for sulfatase activity